MRKKIISLLMVMVTLISLMTVKPKEANAAISDCVFSFDGVVVPDSSKTYSIRFGTDMYMGLSGSANRSSMVVGTSYKNNDAGRFTFVSDGEGSFRIRNKKYSNLYMDISRYGATLAEGQAVMGWSYDAPEACQKYTIVRNSNGSVSFKITGTNFYVGFNDFTMVSKKTAAQFWLCDANGNSLSVCECNVEDCLAGKTVLLRNMYSGRYLNLYHGQTSSGSRIDSYPYDGTNTERWTFTSKGTDKMWIKSVCTSSLAADISGTAVKNRNVCLYAPCGYWNPKVVGFTGDSLIINLEYVGTSNTHLVLGHPDNDLGGGNRTCLVLRNDNTNKVTQWKVCNTSGNTLGFDIYNSSITIAPTAVSINGCPAIFYTGETYNLGATVTPVSATNKSVTWSSSNTNVATVSSSGKLTLNGKGTATIKVSTCNNITASVVITVYDGNPESISLNTSMLKLKCGEGAQLTATVLPVTAKNNAIVWKSDNENIVTVNGSGYVTGKDEGIATITAMTSNGLIASCIVCVEQDDIGSSGEAHEGGEGRHFSYIDDYSIGSELEVGTLGVLASRTEPSSISGSRYDYLPIGTRIVCDAIELNSNDDYYWAHYQRADGRTAWSAIGTRDGSSIYLNIVKKADSSDESNAEWTEWMDAPNASYDGCQCETKVVNKYQYERYLWYGPSSSNSSVTYRAAGKRYIPSGWTLNKIVTTDDYSGANNGKYNIRQSRLYDEPQFLLENVGWDLEGTRFYYENVIPVTYYRYKVRQTVTKETITDYVNTILPRSCDEIGISQNDLVEHYLPYNPIDYDPEKIDFCKLVENPEVGKLFNEFVKIHPLGELINSAGKGESDCNFKEYIDGGVYEAANCCLFGQYWAEFCGSDSFNRPVPRTENAPKENWVRTGVTLVCEPFFATVDNLERVLYGDILEIIRAYKHDLDVIFEIDEYDDVLRGSSGNPKYGFQYSLEEVTYDNLEAWGVVPGTVIRMENSYDKNHGHSMIVVAYSKEEDYIIVLEGNIGHTDRVCLSRYSMKDLHDWMDNSGKVSVPIPIEILFTPFTPLAQVMGISLELVILNGRYIRSVVVPKKIADIYNITY